MFFNTLNLQLSRMMHWLEYTSKTNVVCNTVKSKWNIRLTKKNFRTLSHLRKMKLSHNGCLSKWLWPISMKFMNMELSPLDWFGIRTWKSNFNSQSTSLISCSASVMAWSSMSSNFGNTLGIFRTIIDNAEVPPLVLAVMSAP